MVCHIGRNVSKYVKLSRAARRWLKGQTHKARRRLERRGQEPKGLRDVAKGWAW